MQFQLVGDWKMQPLLAAVVLWLSANFPLPATSHYPHIEFVPAAEMAALRYGSLLGGQRQEIAAINTASASEPVRKIVAIYSDRTKTIFLPTGWTGRTPAELSVLVHEMVHHLQNKAGIVYECPMGREKLAYQAQEQWLQLFGQKLESEFDVDPMTLLVTTSCAFAMMDPR
jgi:hypothetical protein